MRIRNLVICCLTLENGRRGEEPSSLLIKQWEDAKAKKWIDLNIVDNLDDHDRELVDKYILAYQNGKGHRLILVLIPQYCVIGMDILADETNREMMMIPTKNNFLFTSTKSYLHCSGWHAVHEITKEAGVGHINATKNRYYISDQ